MKNKFTAIITKYKGDSIATTIPCEICNNKPSDIGAIIAHKSFHICNNCSNDIGKRFIEISNKRKYKK